LHAALAAVARAIGDALEVREVWDRVGEACQAVAPFDGMGIVQLEPGGRVRAVAVAGQGAIRQLPGQVYARSDFSPTFWPDADDFLVVVRDAATELDMRYGADRSMIERGFRSAIRVPLVHGTERLGSVLLVSRELGTYSEQHGRTLRLISELVAVALAHQGLARKLADETRESAEAQARAAVLEQRVRSLASELDRVNPHRVIGTSQPWRDVLAQALKVAPTDTTVLLSGESGTGKEVVARLIHRESARKDRPFVALNCAALPEQLLESELFGHEKGAFTGASVAHAGKIEQAAGGVLFLDEVGEMSPSVQAKFLRVLQEREFQRLGGTRTQRADVRILAATNRNLRSAVSHGTYREDLYYRLAVFDIALPPLRDRTDDIPALAAAFLESIGRSVGRPAAGFSDEALERLIEYRWPGNVRELRNVIERAMILCDGGTIRVEHLPQDAAARRPSSVERTQPPAPTGVLPTIDVAERDLIAQALTRAGHNKSKAARLLGLTRAQLRSRIGKYGLTGED